MVFLLACVLALNSADTATVGASATQLRQALGISNTDIGLLVAVTSVVAAVFSLPFGILVDRVNRTRLLVWTICLWGCAMIASAAVSSFGSLLLTRVFLGAATAAAGPAVASLVGDYFPSSERGKIYSYVLAGELIGAGIGFAITGDVASLSWRAAFIVLAIPTAALALAIHRLPEPARGGASQMPPGTPEVLGEGGAGVGDEPPTVPLDIDAGVHAGVHAGLPPDQDSVHDTDAQRIARDRGVKPLQRLILRRDPREMGFVSAVRYVLSIPTNVILIISSACGYFFLAGISTFGVEFAKGQYRIGQALANVLMLVLGGGAIIGVLVGGRLGDFLLHRRYLNGRILVPAIAALGAVVVFVPALLTHSVKAAVPYFIAAAFFLTAQNPPIDAARLDIMPPLLWGRAEGVRTFLRTTAQALAPLLFGGLSDLLGGGHTSLEYTFIVMLLPMAASGLVLLRALRTYPSDVATAAASLAADRPDPDLAYGEQQRLFGG